MLGIRSWSAGAGGVGSRAEPLLVDEDEAAAEARMLEEDDGDEAVAAGAAGEEGDLEGPQWECSACTFLNNPLLAECEICGTRRPLSSLPDWTRSQQQQQQQRQQVGAATRQDELDVASLFLGLRPEEIAAILAEQQRALDEIRAQRSGAAATAAVPAPPLHDYYHKPAGGSASAAFGHCSSSSNGESIAEQLRQVASLISPAHAPTSAAPSPAAAPSSSVAPAYDSIPVGPHGYYQSKRRKYRHHGASSSSSSSSSSCFPHDGISDDEGGEGDGEGGQFYVSAEASLPEEKRAEIVRGILDAIAVRQDVKEKPAPPALRVRLMPHQKLGFSWMSEQELSSYKGGLLADEMGLGKTVQAIALLVLNRSPNPARKATLVVCPLAVLAQWESELQRFTQPGALQVHRYHGPGRMRDPAKLAQFDVVLTTYSLVGQEALTDKDRQKDPSRLAGPLFHVDWFRAALLPCSVILDEGQSIKNKSSRCAKGCFELRAERRWILSGTPLQNRIEEMYSVFRFLRVEPWDQPKYFNQLTRRMKSLNQRSIHKFQAVMQAIMLRRKKEPTLREQLPERKVVLRAAKFTQDEQDFYNALEKRAQLAFNRFLKQGAVMQHYSDILVLLLRLRQACDHPHLLPFLRVESGKEGEAPKLALELLSPEVLDRILAGGAAAVLRC